VLVESTKPFLLLFFAGTITVLLLEGIKVTVIAMGCCLACAGLLLDSKWDGMGIEN
jgi:hypothetical protein